MKFRSMMFAIGALVSSPSWAVMAGTPLPATQSSTFEIYLTRALPMGADVSGTCSAVVVGLRPLTLLTASHCFKNIVLDNETRLPLVQLLGPGKDHWLTAAVYNDYAAVKVNGSDDVAVLVFEGAEELVVNPIPVASNLELSEPVLLCGFGYADSEGPSSAPRCAQRDLIRDVTDLNLFIPPAYKESDWMTHLKYEAQFRVKETLFTSPDRFIGVNRLADGEYSARVAMPREGDSGGPWFSRAANGSLRLVALTSVVETFQYTNKVWPVFRDRSIKTENLPYAAYGITLRTPEARSVFERARKLGARILEEDLLTSSYRR